MPIIKDLTLAATGGVASYHVLRVVALDLAAKTTNATLVSYVSADTFAAGKQPATYEMLTVAVNGLPGDGANITDFIEAELVRVTTPEEQNLAGNRALFEGGVIAP
jgi:hypothetical protein